MRNNIDKDGSPNKKNAGPINSASNTQFNIKHLKTANLKVDPSESLLEPTFTDSPEPQY